MSRLRWVSGAATALLGLDLLGIVVTGSASLLDLGRHPVGPAGFAVRGLVLAVVSFAHFRLLAEPVRRVDGRWLVLWLMLLPTLTHFQYGGGRINGDGVMYYVYVRSLWKDFDLDFTNEYTHYGLAGRGDLAVRTTTGLRRSIFSFSEKMQPQ